MNTKKYKVGGIVNSDTEVYVVRKADKKIQELLKKKEYCYVLNAKQMGKSSLAKEAIKELKKEEIYSVFFTLEDVSAKDEKGWYDSFIWQLMPQIMTEINLTDFDWKNYYKDYLADNPDPVAALSSLLHKIIGIIQKDLIIFIDEIDKMRHVKFEIDSFFNKIRSLYNKRDNASSWANHITFCLIGTATPNFFIKDQYTSFNIAKRIELSEIQWEEAKEPFLAAGLKTEFKKNAESILRRVFYWTNGQPYLTQRLCELLVGSRDENSKIILLENEIESNIQLFVDNFVDENIIKNWRKKDDHDHIRYISDQINTVALLETYRKILESKDKKIIANDDIGEIELELRLSGLVIRTQDEGEYYLKAFNRIYEEALNLSWVEKKLAEIKPYAEKFEAWLGANEEIKQRYLLYGKELEYDLKWAEDKQISNNKEHQFLNDSRNFLRDFKKGLLGDPDKDSDDFDYQAIINAIFLWTGGIKSLNNIILQSVKTIFKKQNKPINKGEEQTSLETYINQRLTPSKKDLKIDTRFNNHRQEISDHILKGDNFDPILLLWSYREILEQGEVEFNETPEHQKLTDMCLIIKEGNKLKIINKIYTLLFDRGWFDKQLKDITTDLVNKIWQSATEEDKSKTEEDKCKAVDIIIKVNPQLKGKTNPLYGFIQKVLEHTASDRDLLEKLLEKACEKENIPSEQQDKWIEEQLPLLKPNDISQEILASWIKSYEKAIVARNPHYSKAKEIIDIAFCKLVEQLVKFTNDAELQNSDIDTVKYCIEYLADNLIRLGIWKEHERPKPTIDNSTETKNELRIQVNNCSYKEECEWAKDESAFVDPENEGEKYKKYRCQRLGCCVGAVKKYMKDNNLPEEQIDKVKYFMETAIETTEEDMNAGIKCKCIGLIFIN